MWFDLCGGSLRDGLRCLPLFCLPQDFLCQKHLGLDEAPGVKGNRQDKQVTDQKTKERSWEKEIHG